MTRIHASAARPSLRPLAFPAVAMIFAAVACAALAGAQDPVKIDETSKIPELSESTLGKTPLWQLKPFDRFQLKNEQKTNVDIEPDRLPKNANFDNVEENNYCGQPGLPWPGTKFRKDLWYRYTSAADGRKYEVIGKGLAKIEHYEDIMYNALQGLLKVGDAQPNAVKYDDCLEFLRILQERQPNTPRVIYARIRFHALEAMAAELRQDFERAYQILLEERPLLKTVPSEPKMAVPQEIKSMQPVDERIGRLCDRWTGYLVNTRRYGEGRRVIARLEGLFPNHEVGQKWRADYDARVKPIVQLAQQQIANGFLVEAHGTLDQAIDVQPDHPVMRATMDELYRKHPRLRVAVGELPAYHSGPAGWSPADRRAAELLHEPLMRVKSIDKDGSAIFDSRIVSGLEAGDLNRRAAVQVRTGLVWPDGKPVTPVDVQRLFADARQRTGNLYHPALEFLLTNIQSQPPETLLLEFDRPQFQARAWLQLPFLRMSRDPLATQATQGLGWSGLGPFRVRERRPDRVTYLANPKFLEPGKPAIKMIVETKIGTPEQRFRALEMGEVEMVGFVPWRNLPYVNSLKNVKVVKRGAPTLCLLQLNFNREAIRSPDLRRAIVYALDRRAIVDRLGAAEDKDVKLLNGPVAVDGFGYNAKINPRTSDSFTAKVLVRAVEKNLKSLPPLTLAHQGNESTRMACDEIAKQLKAVGLQCTVVEVDERSPDPRAADMRFQAVSVSDPIFDLVTVLTRDNPSLFENAGPRLRQLLIQLLQVPNATVAKALLPEVHQSLNDEIAMIPLWQWQETFLASDGVMGLSPAPATVYQGVSNWQTAPRYPPAYWETKPIAALPAWRDSDRIALREDRQP